MAYREVRNWEEAAFTYVQGDPRTSRSVHVKPLWCSGSPFQVVKIPSSSTTRTVASEREQAHTAPCSNTATGQSQQDPKTVARGTRTESSSVVDIVVQTNTNNGSQESIDVTAVYPLLPTADSLLTEGSMQRRNSLDMKMRTKSRMLLDESQDMAAKVLSEHIKQEHIDALPLHPTGFKERQTETTLQDSIAASGVLFYRIMKCEALTIEKYRTCGCIKTSQPKPHNNALSPFCTIEFISNAETQYRVGNTPRKRNTHNPVFQYDSTVTLDVDVPVPLLISPSSGIVLEDDYPEEYENGYINYIIDPDKGMDKQRIKDFIVAEAPKRTMRDKLKGKEKDTYDEIISDVARHINSGEANLNIGFPYILIQIWNDPLFHTWSPRLIGYCRIHISELLLNPHTSSTRRLPVYNIDMSGHTYSKGHLIIALKYVPFGMSTPIQYLNSIPMGVSGSWLRPQSSRNLLTYYFDTPSMSSCYYLPRSNNLVTLYKDGEVAFNYDHWNDGCGLFQDIYSSIIIAKHFIYIAGWSVNVKIRLGIRKRVYTPANIEEDPDIPQVQKVHNRSCLGGKDGRVCVDSAERCYWVEVTTLGELLKKKADEGCHVVLLLWNDITSTRVKKQGLMNTADEFTRSFFRGTKVKVALLPKRVLEGRKGMVKSMWSKAIFTHHQKIVCTDGPLTQNVELPDVQEEQHSAADKFLGQLLRRFKNEDSKTAKGGPEPKEHIASQAKAFFEGILDRKKHAKPSKRQVIAFVGGMDLTSGRNDTPDHSLFDPYYFSNQDTFYNGSLPGSSNSTGPRQPWHDIHSKIVGSAALDVLSNFLERATCQMDTIHNAPVVWIGNLIQKNILITFQQPTEVKHSESAPNWLKTFYRRVRTSVSSVSSLSSSEVNRDAAQSRLFPPPSASRSGRSLQLTGNQVTPRKKKVHSADIPRPYKKSPKNTGIHRFSSQNYEAPFDIHSIAFQRKRNRLHTKSVGRGSTQQRSYSQYQPGHNRTEITTNRSIQDSISLNTTTHIYLNDITRVCLPTSLSESLKYIHQTVIFEDTSYIKSNEWNVQILRSIDAASACFSRAECSSWFHEHKKFGVESTIYWNYLYQIQRAKSFIYIENQYFYGSCQFWGDRATTKCPHLVPYAIARKICQKIRGKEKFGAVIIIPLHSEGSPDHHAIQEILYFQFQTIQMMYKMIGKAISETYPSPRPPSPKQSSNEAAVHQKDPPSPLPPPSSSSIVGYPKVKSYSSKTNPERESHEGQSILISDSESDSSGRFDLQISDTSDTSDSVYKPGEKPIPTDFLSFFFLAKREADTKGLPLKKSTNKKVQKHVQHMRHPIYVHSKMMIVDDEYITLGSANINQRSLDGSRDTEINIGAYQVDHRALYTQTTPHNLSVIRQLMRLPLHDPVRLLRESSLMAPDFVAIEYGGLDIDEKKKRERAKLRMKDAKKRVKTRVKKPIRKSSHRSDNTEKQKKSEAAKIVQLTRMWPYICHIINEHNRKKQVYLSQDVKLMFQKSGIVVSDKSDTLTKLVEIPTVTSASYEDEMVCKILPLILDGGDAELTTPRGEVYSFRNALYKEHFGEDHDVQTPNQINYLRTLRRLGNANRKTYIGEQNKTLPHGFACTYPYDISPTGEMTINPEFEFIPDSANVPLKGTLSKLYYHDDVTA